MKDQTNLIVVIVAIVFMIGFSLAFALTQRKPLTLADPPVVPTADVKTAEGAVVYANALPNAGSGTGTGGAGGASSNRGRGGPQGGGGRASAQGGGNGPMQPTGVSSAGK